MRHEHGGFETRDFYLACFLRWHRLRTDRHLRAQGQRKVFVFHDRPCRREDVLAFRYGDGAVVPPLAFSATIKDMKALLADLTRRRLVDEKAVLAGIVVTIVLAVGEDAARPPSAMAFGHPRPSLRALACRRAGRDDGPLLGYEAFTAFVLEATFFGIVMFGRSRVPPWFYFLSCCIVALGTIGVVVLDPRQQ